MTPLTLGHTIYSVSQLNLEVRELLEQEFSAILVAGEISNLRRPSSGHVYFSLKDSLAQVRCAMFRFNSEKLSFELKEGLQVMVRARISLYEERGDFQLIIEQMEESGQGALQQAFEQLKLRLAKEGLFEEAHKKPLPAFPKCVGIITSSTGAAIRDILTVLKRRFSGINVIIYPTQVQGQTAAPQIVKAIQIANSRKECEVLIVARGGGSLEDLWPFNEEIVARAIFASEIPIVSGVGHEIDFTICDFVADKRASTPSAAAELISPNIRDIAQRIDYFENRIVNLHSQYLNNIKIQIDYLFSKLQRYHPQHFLHEIKNNLIFYSQRMSTAIQNQIEQSKQHLHGLSRALSTVSPLNTLQRGYAIVMQDEKVITSVQQVQGGKKLTVKLSDGVLDCLPPL